MCNRTHQSGAGWGKRPPAEKRFDLSTIDPDRIPNPNLRDRGAKWEEQNLAKMRA